jgi:NAD(P)-dependent dehydrogenase (short-subunit alcohol dehydrogenase family)
LSRLMGVMRTNGGVITITSSTGGLRGSVGLAPYSASKHAVIGLMKSAALEGAPFRIRVNTVHPGPTDTRMMKDILAAQSTPYSAEDGGAMTPLGRPGDPSEIANLICFLCSDEASFCTGGTYLADGGVIAGRA